MTDVYLSEIPLGATVNLTFGGELLSGSEDAGFATFKLDDGSVLKVDWEIKGDPVEDYAPHTAVLDYGFRPGDVVVRRAEATGTEPSRYDTFLATEGTTDERPIDWVGTDGLQVVDFDESTLTLVMRDGFRVPSRDDE